MIYFHKNSVGIEDIINYIKLKDIHINHHELRSALFSTQANGGSVIVSKNQYDKIDGILFGFKSENNNWNIQGFFFDSKQIASELAKYAFINIKPEYISYKKFIKNNTYKWGISKIKKYIEIIN